MTSEFGSSLPAETRARLVECLRAGCTLGEAAAQVNITVDALRAAAATDRQLADASAQATQDAFAQDAFAQDEKLIQQQADLLRGVALGMTVADAASSAGVSVGTVAAWSARDDRFNVALSATRAMADAPVVRPRTRMTPARVLALLWALQEGETVARAAVRAGVAHSTIYYRKARDPGFAELLMEAQKAGMQARARRRSRSTSLRTARYRLVRIVGEIDGEGEGRSSR